MLAILSDVVRNIVILIILVSIMEMLLPRKDFRPFVNMVVGLALMLMLLAPLRSLLQLPGLLDPVIEMRDSITEEDVAERQVILEQMNWDLTLERYRQLVEEKIAAVLRNEDLVIVSINMKVEEDVNNLEFGTPRYIEVVAQTGAPTEDDIAPVERVQVEIGGEMSTPTREREREVEAQVADVLGISRNIVEVYVLTH
ncbi:MAG: stage III sporulation protein AF [Firmicutes bacterium]|nr:stage III sporulation protein AF [Bacillota bacterium]